MRVLVRAALLLSPLLVCNAFLDLTGPSEVKGVWKGSATLPCTYVPVKGFVQQTLKWTVVHDHSSSTVFWRDGSDDNILLSKYRGRVSVPRDTPGNVSLHIQNLQISDRGTYACRVTWRASNNSLIAKEITTEVEVVKVAVTKPVIRAGELGLAVPAGARTSLTCVADGSPPISYRWFRSTPGGKALLLSSQAELAWDRLQPSDAGKYYCEAENRAGARAVQQSDTVELTVRGSPVTQQPSAGTDRHARPPLTPRGSGTQQVPTEPLYEVAFCSTADVMRLETDVEVPVKCLHKKTNCKTETFNDTFTVKDDSHNSIYIRKNPEYENLVSAMESEYETERI
uniref:V-set and immunoglobulin domain containing 4 n=1 Tax=Falco tinnunculus TaxID=100819 RepID=A0A8C4V8D8_FALTI